MSKVADYSWARPGGAALKAHGFDGAMRYLSYDTGKNISKAEFDDLRNNGVALGLVWESTANRSLSGKAAGVSDAQEALRQANALGFTGALYFGVDFDAAESQQGAINDYFNGVLSVIDKSRVGIYAGYWPLKRAFDAGLVTFGWQTVAWSGSNRDPRAHLLQDATQDFGGQVDNNVVLQANYGQMGADASPSTPSQPAPAPSVSDDGVYNVVAGDTLSGIAAKFGTTYQALAAANGIADPNKISVGQQIKVHGGASAPAPTVSNGQSYTVVSGDTLSGIAAKYGLTYQVIANANGIADPNKIYTGQVLRIPATNVSTPAPSAGVVYVVQSGDTLSGIASAYGTNYQHLAQINGIADPNKIYAGQSIRIS